MDAFDREMVELQMLIVTIGRQLEIITALIQRLRRRQQRAEGPQRVCQYWFSLQKLCEDASRAVPGVGDQVDRTSGEGEDLDVRAIVCWSQVSCHIETPGQR